ncbi:MAG: translocation/assembly module TamB domain-containing protein [Candidatus Zixiibacteriota bacterium]
MKKLLKIVSISCVSLLIFVVLSVLYLTSLTGENRTKKWLENQIASEIGLPVSIGRFETNLWTHITIDTLTIASGGNEEVQPLAYVGQIRLRYSIPDLLSRTVRLKELAVDSVAISIKLDSLGHFGIPLIDAPDSASMASTGKTTTVSIGTVSINRVSFDYQDFLMPFSVKASGTTLIAQGSKSDVYSGHLNVSSILASYNNIVMDVNDLEVVASLDKEALNISYARANCEGLYLEASGEVGFSDPKEMALSATAKGSLDSLAANFALAFDLPPFGAGEANIIARVDGFLDDPNIALDGAFSDLTLSSVTIDSARLQAQYSNEQLIIDSLYISTLGGKVSGNAIASMDSSGPTSLALKLNSISLSDLWQAVYAKASPYKGELHGTVGASGPIGNWSSWKLDAVIAGKDLQYDNKTIPDLSCTARLESGNSVWSLVHGADKAHAELTFREDSLQGTFDVSIPEAIALASFFDQHELSGGLWANGTIAGTYTNPTIHATVNASQVIYHNFPIDTVFATLSYFDSNFIIIGLVCDGKLDPIDSHRSPFDLDSIGGSMAYNCQLSGSISDLKGEFSAELTGPRYSSYMADSIEINAILNGSQVELREMTINHDRLSARMSAIYDTISNSGSFDLGFYPLIRSSQNTESTVNTTQTRSDFGTITGEFSLGPDYNLSVTAQGKELWLGLLPLLAIDSTVSDGELAFDLSIDGPYKAPNAVFDARIRSLALPDYMLDSVITHLKLDKQAVVLDSLVSYALGQSLRASGEIELGLSEKGVLELPASAPVIATLDIRQFDLSVMKEMMLPAGDIAGAVSASLKLSGTTSLPCFDGWLKATGGRFLLNDISSPIDDIAMSLSFTDSVLTIDNATGIASSIPFEVRGSITSSDYESAIIALDVHVGEFGKLDIDGSVSDSSVRLEVSIDTLNLGVFQPFAPELDSLSGRVGARMIISGSLEEPLIDGTLLISTLAFQSVRQNVILADGHASVNFDKNRVILDSVSASINGGNLILSGDVNHDQGELTDIGLSLRANNITWEEPESFVLLVDSAVLSYGKQQETYVLHGDVVLGETRLTKGIRPTAVLPWVQELETVDLEWPGLIARSRLDVRIRESDQLWIDNNLAHIRLRSEVGIIGTPVRPNLTGLIRVEEGYLLYLDRRFRVNEGSVYFNDPNRFNPDIKLDASTQVTVYRRSAAEPYTIYIKAEGLLDQLQYELFSQPPLEKPDIVALLTLGATRSELTKSGENQEKTGLTQVLKDRAAMMTSQKVSNYISRRAGSLFGFDEFTIQGNLFKFDETWGPQLVASKRVSQRINLTYSTTVGHLNDQTMRLGYSLTPRWSLQGETDRQGCSGLDLKYGITFK